MKRILFSLFIFCFSFLLPPSVSAQCSDYFCVIAKVKNAMKDKNYRLVFEQLESAEGYPDKNDEEITKFRKELFVAVENEKQEAIKARDNAKRLEKRADEERKKKEVEADNANRAKNTADSLRNEVDSAYKKEKSLIEKGEKLRNTFSSDKTYELLFTEGLDYFAYDSVEQARNYVNALAYFALARFLNPSDTLNNLVKASQLGLLADQYFFDGKLDSAEHLYRQIQLIDNLLINKINYNYETMRLQNIKEVRSRFDNLKLSNESLIFDGNWWTIPESISKFKTAKYLIFKNNLANYHGQIPSALSNLDSIRYLEITKCPNLKSLENWESVNQLETLILSDNIHLTTLDSLNKLPNLKDLSISNCRALTVIGQLKKLESFNLEGCPDAPLLGILANNPNLQKMTLADITDTSRLDTKFLTNLEELNLYRMSTYGITGFENNKPLKILKIEDLDNIKSVDLPQQARFVAIKDCDKISDLSNWQSSNNLEKLLLYKNDMLTKLPSWQLFPNVKNLLIQENNELKRIGNLKALKKVDRILLMYNRKIPSTSIGIDINPIFLDRLIFRRDDYEAPLNINLEHRRHMKNSELGFNLKTSIIFLNYTLPYYRIDNYVFPYVSPKGFTAIRNEITTHIFLPSYGYIGAGFGLWHKKYYDYNVKTSAQYTASTYQNTETIALSKNTNFKKSFYGVVNGGIKLAPRFFKKDRISINGIFTFGKIPDGSRLYHVTSNIIYFHVIDLSRKVYLIRPSEGRKFVRISRKEKVKISNLPDMFEKGK